MVVRVRDCAFQDGSYPCDYKDGDKLPDCDLCHKSYKAGTQAVLTWLDQHDVSVTYLKSRFGKGFCNHLRRWGVE